MANSKIRGITIELSADATGVLDSVKKIDSQIKSTGTQLKDVNRLLKFDPSNTTLLSQKTNLLQQNIESTKAKLEELKKAQADMDANGVDKNSQQYQALQREIIATEQDLKQLQGTLGSGSATLAAISVKTGEWGEKMEDVGKKMSVVSAGLVALGTAAVNAFNEVDAGMDAIIKKTGATGEDAEELEQIYKDIAGSVVGDFEEIGTAIGETSTRFGVTGDDLEDLATLFLKFANINDTDVTNAIEGAQKALGAFGLDATDAEALLNRLTSVSQDTGASVDELASGLVQNGTAFQEMGLNIDQATVLMGQMEKSGANTETVMAGLRKALKNAAEDGVPLNDALADLQDTILNGTDGMDGLTAAYDLFGKSGDQIYNAVKNGTLDFADLAIAVGDVSGAVENTYDATLDGTDKMALAWQNVKLSAAELGEAIGDTLAPIMDKIVSVIQKVTEWFSNLDDGTKKTIVTIGLVVAAIGPLLVIGGKLMKGISSITGALSKLGGSSFGPIGLVVAGVTALYTAISSVVGSWQTAYEESSPFTEALASIQEANGNLNDSLANTKTNYENTVAASEANAAAADGLYQHLLNLIAGYDGTDAAQLAIQSTIDQLNQLVPGLALQWDSVTNSLNLTTDEVYAHIEAMKAQAQVAALQEMYTDSLKDQYYAEKNLTEARKALAGVLASHNVTMEEALALARDDNITTAEAIQFLTEHGIAIQDATGYYNELMTALGEYFDASGNAQEATENVTFAENEMSNAMVAAAEAAQNSKDDIIAAADDINNQVDFSTAEATAAEAGENIPQDMADGINANSATVGTAADNLAAEVNDGLSTLPSDTTTAGSEAGSGLESGFAGWKSTVSGTVDTMYEFFNSTLGTTLPAMMSTWGSNSGMKFNSGLKLWSTDVQTTAGNIKTYIQNVLAALPGYLQSIGSQAGAGLYYGLSSWQGSLTNLANSIANSINAAARRALQIKSPSRVMMEVGRYTGEGLQIGLEKSADGIYATMNDITGTIAGMSPDLNAGISAMNASINAGNQRVANAAVAETFGINTILQLLSTYLPVAAANKDIYFNDGTWAGKLAPAINQEMGQMAIMAGR